jgi:hypothetical protein
LTRSSLHIIVSDLDVRVHTAIDGFLDDYPWMMSNPITQNRNLLLYKNINALIIAKVQMLNKPYIHYIDIKVMNNVSRKPLD